VLQPGDEVLHLVSDAGTIETQQTELREFVAVAGLPRSLLNNPHLVGPGRPHLDVWGKPARKAARALGTGEPRRSAVRGPRINLSDLREIRALRLEYFGSMGLSASRAGARGPAPDRRSGMARRGHEHSCEVCRTLSDIVRALEPEKYRCGPELELAEAIQDALGKHLKRVGKRKESTGE